MTEHAADSNLFTTVLREVLSSLLAPDLRARVLERATGGRTLALADASDALSFVVGPLLRALEQEVGPLGAGDLVNDIRDILEPLVEERPRPRQMNSGRQLRTSRPADEGDAGAPNRTTQPAKSGRKVDPSERATPAAGIRRPAIAQGPGPGQGEASEFDDVPTADLPVTTLDALRDRDTQGPPARSDSPFVIFSSDAERGSVLLQRLGDESARWVGAGEPPLLALLLESPPAGTVFVVDCLGGASARDLALHLSRLPRHSTVIVWGSERADLSREEMAVLGFIQSSSDASPQELAEMLHGLRAA